MDVINHRRNCRGWWGLGSISLLFCCMTRTKRICKIQKKGASPASWSCAYAGSVCRKSRFCLMWLCMYTQFNFMYVGKCAPSALRFLCEHLGLQSNIWPAREVQASILRTPACFNFSPHKMICKCLPQSRCYVWQVKGGTYAKSSSSQWCLRYIKEVNFFYWKPITYPEFTKKWKKTLLPAFFVSS
jgi:hypothetical protein